MSLLLVISLGDREIRHPLAPGRLTIGRAHECDVVVDDPSVSRQHAELAVADGGGGVTIRDLGSRNGTWVNDRRVAVATAWAPGDEARVAGIRLQLLAGESRGLDWAADATNVFASAELSWREITEEGGEAAALPARLFGVMVEAGELLAQSHSVDDLFAGILELVAANFDPERSVLLLREPDQAEPVVRASRSRASQSTAPMALSRTMIQRVISGRASLLTTDAQIDPRFRGHESVVMQRVRSAMAAPLFDNEGVIGLLYADTSERGRVYSRDELRAFTIMANLVAVKITQTRLAESEKEKRRLTSELQAARDIIDRILPAEPAAPPGWDLCVRLQPCSEVGGDFYDVRHLPDGRWALILGDVAGKGLGAALLASSVVAMLDVLLDEPGDLHAVMARLSRRVWHSAGPTRYATLFLGLLDPVQGRLVYVNAGHVPPLLVRAEGALEAVKSTGPPAGLLDGAAYQTGELQLAPGDSLAAFSDGVTEAWNAEEDDYGDDRLRALLGRARGRSAAAVVDAVTEDLAGFLAGVPLSDDLTLLVLRRP